MNKAKLSLSILCLLFGIATVAQADLDGLIADLNVRARTDLDGFTSQVSIQFGVPIPQVKVILAAVPTPADAFLCFQVGLLARKPADVVLASYKTHKGLGWGVTAQELGIQPGSQEFKALKDGSFALTGKPAGEAAGERGRGKVRGQGRDKGNKKH